MAAEQTAWKQRKEVTAMIAYENQRAIIGPRGYAGFGPRLVAFLIDSVVIGVLATIATFGRPVPVATQGIAEAVNWHNGMETLIAFGYFTILWSWIGGGETVGMHLLGLRVVGADGKPIGFLAAVGRWIGMVVSAAVLLVGLVWVAFDPRNQGWHDKLAGTFVVHGAMPVVPARADAAGATVDRPHPVARGFAVIIGIFGAVLGLLGFGLGLAGDAALPAGRELWAAGVLAAIALVAAAVAWWRPGYAALALAIVAGGYGIALGAFVGPWWDGYNAAIVNPITEQQYWADAPAVASFLVSGVMVALAALLSAFGALGGIATAEPARGQ